MSDRTPEVVEFEAAVTHIREMLKEGFQLMQEQYEAQALIAGTGPDWWAGVSTGLVRFGRAIDACRANVRLIAAAPQLLEGVKRWASECANCNGTGVSFDAHCEDCADIRALIDLATKEPA